MLSSSQLLIVGSHSLKFEDVFLWGEPSLCVATRRTYNGLNFFGKNELVVVA